MAKYVIDGATLMDIAEAIRENEMWNGDWDGVFMTPEEMPSAIGAVRVAGYNEGYYAGQRQGLEALGKLCDWFVVLDSEELIAVRVRNYHPSYYLHCDVAIDDYGENYGVVGTLVVPPNSIKTASTDGYMFASADVTVSVKNVRWKASAT